MASLKKSLGRHSTERGSKISAISAKNTDEVMRFKRLPNQEASTFLDFDRYRISPVRLY